MANSRKIIQIFLASPGDLQNERQTAKLVVDAFNKRWADWFDIQIELVGWEDTFKRFGRPQAQINLDLDRCEAFIGLMWRKWGTPPGGDYTSGFEEEFERALASRMKSTRPEMTLFFKKIDDEFLKDRGPDLNRVLAFRQRVIEEQQILFHDFENLKDFEDKLNDWITHYVKHLKKLEDTTAKADEKAPSLGSVPEKSEATNSSDTLLSPQGAQFLRHFVAKTERDQKAHPIEAVDVARFRLLAGMIGVASNDEDFLGTHDANLLFQSRDALDLSRREMMGLVDSGLDSIASETIPFWHWYDTVKGGDRSYLCVSTLVGPQGQRVGALIAMRLIGEPIVPLEPLGPDDETAKRSFFTSTWLSSRSSERLKTAALQYLSACGEPEDLPALKGEYDKRNYQTAAAAADAIIRINLRLSREPEDLERIRGVVSSGFANFSMLDIEFLRKHGEWQDISLLISMLDRPDTSATLLGGILDDRTLEAVAQAVYAIGKSRFSELCKEKMPPRLLQRILGLASDKEVVGLSDQELTEIYHSDETHVRKAILLKSVRALPKTRLKRLLKEQLTQDRLRYYNVSYWLDLGITLTRKQVLHVLEMSSRKP
ncbi:uncharacterized protein DUF4062 [Bradyrhizobium macuxiense]|uniref:Uncharacterized protein DUF4062 n=1 Tax=Bradyrhizobium macuxiense TaxID=1755647 RepID=A0A560L7I2_9BRAD|nr:DUF4062 domain-containing protein [Bradyrhizobium macuxiense]TWB91295.1 uncharacterized protein DUF4062 [Bradyrhizobium macuxiense]